MSDHLVTVTTNTVVDRLRVLQSDLTIENRHTDALLLDLAIQVIAGKPSTLAFLMNDIEARMRTVALQSIEAATRKNPNFARS